MILPLELAPDNLGIMACDMEGDGLPDDVAEAVRSRYRVEVEEDLAMDYTIPKSRAVARLGGSSRRWTPRPSPASNSGYRGVQRRRYGFDAKIGHIHLGYSKDPTVCARLYDAAARERYGDMAICNFPEEG